MTATAPGGTGVSAPLHDVLAALRVLDEVLRDRVRRFRGELPGAPAESDGLTAYYVPDAEVDALLGAEPDDAARPALHALRAAAPGGDPAGPGTRLDDLAATLGLAPADTDAVLALLALEVDRRYERLYGYLQDDVTRRVPTVGLLLDLAAAGRAERVAGRARFRAGAPLLRHGVVVLEDEPGRRAASLLDRVARLDPRITRHLLAEGGGGDVDDRLRDVAEVLRPAPGPAPAPRLPGGDGAPVAVRCTGPAGESRAAAEAYAAGRGLPLLAVRCGPLAELPPDELDARLALLDREALLHGALTCWEQAGTLLESPRAALARKHWLRLTGPVFLVAEPGEPEWRPAATEGFVLLPVAVPPPDAAARTALWREHAGADDGTAARLGATFRLGAGAVRDAAATARALAADPAAPTAAELLDAARRHSNRTLARLADRVEPRAGWADLVLPAEQLAQLRGVAGLVRHRGTVHEVWGFGGGAAAARGVNVMFAGPPGTGKTMAASVLAAELGVDLYRIDLSATVSKYIGETERNLSRIFAEAETSNAVLFFDEADALFGRRTQVKDAHDRYANLETSYLLQRLETHDLLVVLATNLRKNVDEAFVRRLHAVVDFPVPSEAERRLIWRRLWPAAAPLAPDADLDRLARVVELPGGHLRNIALAAAFLAAADGGGEVTAAHLAAAVREEHRKLGSVLPSDALHDLTGP